MKYINTLFCLAPSKILCCTIFIFVFQIKTFTQTTVDISVSQSTGTESGMTLINVTATSSAPVSGNQTVNINVTGSNITPLDYAISDNTITIPNGMTNGTVTFTVNNDATIESLETAVISLNNPSAGLTLGTTPTAMIHIEDNDIVNTATLYNRAYLKNNSLITVQGKPYSSSGTTTGSGALNASFINNGIMSPGNN